MRKNTDKEKITQLENKIAEMKKAESNKYVNWENDLGFLNFILSRKKSIVIDFLVATYSKQLQDTDYLKDDDVEPIVENVVVDTLGMLGESYKAFLIEKYFGSEQKLIEFIAEDVYINLTSDAIERNNQKIKFNIKQNLVRKALSNITGKE